jgi:hypothetical protein
MSTYKFAELPSNESVASATTFLISAWFLVAAGAMLAEPSVDSQVRALTAKTPVVTVRQITAQAEQPDARFTIEVVAKRDAGRVS